MKLKGMQKMDWLMIVLLAVIFIDMDFANMEILDYVLAASSCFWVVMLAIRLYVENKK